MTEIRIALTPELKVLARNHRFALLTKQHNPGASGTALAYEHAQKNLFDVLRATSRDNTLDSIQKVNWDLLRTDEDSLFVDLNTRQVPATQSALRVTELARIASPSAFALDLAADRKKQFEEKWSKLITTDVDHISLRDWPDDLLTELLWEIAHQPSQKGSFIGLRFDDDTVCNFPVGVLQVSNEQPSDDGEKLFLSMISNRHPEMDAMTHGSLFLNRETQLDGELNLLAAATCERAVGFLRCVPRNLKLHVFQTGLAAVVVGLWLGVIEAKSHPATGETYGASEVPRWNIIPRFFRQLEGGAPSSQEAFARGRAW